MKRSFLESNPPLREETLSLSAKLSMMVLEKVDTLYTHQCQSMCRRYHLRNGAFSRVKKKNLLPGDHLQLWQMFLICRDIEAKLKSRPADLREWQLILRNELCRALGIDTTPPP